MRRTVLHPSPHDGCLVLMIVGTSLTQGGDILGSMRSPRKKALVHPPPGFRFPPARIQWWQYGAGPRCEIRTVDGGKGDK